MLHATEVMAIFVIVWPILPKIWLPWQRPLDPCNQKCLLWIGRPQKPPVISNHILIISRRNPLIYAFRAILVPKLVTMVMGVGTWGQGGQQPTLEKIREFPPWKYQPWSENFQAVVRQ